MIYIIEYKTNPCPVKRVELGGYGNSKYMFSMSYLGHLDFNINTDLTKPSFVKSECPVTNTIEYDIVWHNFIYFDNANIYKKYDCYSNENKLNDFKYVENKKITYNELKKINDNSIKYIGQIIFIK